MSKSSKMVCGTGIKGTNYPASVGGKMLKEYNTWKSMLLRCTSKYWQKYPTYLGVACSENFKSYSYFYEWCQEQVGFKNTDSSGECWHLDKDLLFKGNKLYSEDTCVFIPQRVNYLLNKHKIYRGEHPIGVCWHKTTCKFISYCRGVDGKRKHLGVFNTPQEAFLAYKTFKEALIKQVANEYKNLIDPRAYQALVNYEVNEND